MNVALEQNTRECPNPQEMASIYAEVARRASHLIGEHVQRQLQKGIRTPSDELASPRHSWT